MAQYTQKYGATRAPLVSRVSGLGCQSIRAMGKKEVRNVPGKYRAAIKVKVGIEILSSFVDDAILIFNKLSLRERSFCSW